MPVKAELNIGELINVQLEYLCHIIIEYHFKGFNVHGKYGFLYFRGEVLQFVFHQTQEPPFQTACTSFGEVNFHPKNSAVFSDFKAVIKAVIWFLRPISFLHLPSFPPDSNLLCFREKVFFLFHSSLSGFRLIEGFAFYYQYVGT